MITLTPAQSQYLEQVATGLADLPAEEREEVMQDLSAHLAELGDEEIVPTLGTPAAFVAEFRASAGLDKPGRLAGLFAGWRARSERWSAALSDLTRWPRLRPFWVWTRGWLVLGVFAAVNESIAFHHFPIPAANGDTLLGIVAVVGATWLSVWIDRRPRGTLRDIASVVYSALGVWALAVGLLGGAALGYPAEFVEHEELFSHDYPVLSLDGHPVENIYAFDRSGEPVEVLLFDQLGRPLLVLPSWVYEEAEMSPGGEAEYPNGYVTFPRDEFGRILPNLYPLQLQTWDEWGVLAPAEPPAAWSVPDEESAGSTPPTTTGRVDAD